MATSSGTDVAALSDSQREALENYTAITNQEVDAAVSLLRRAEWNVQIAISRFFDGEPTTDPVAEALEQRPEDVRRQETLMNGFSTRPTPRASGNLEPAPRIVPQNDGQVGFRTNPLAGILLMPISVIYAVLSRAFRLFGYLFPFLPRFFNRLGGTPQGASSRHNAGGRIALKPRDAALRLAREIEEEYGPNELPFFANGYAQALDTAKRDLKFLLVVLISPEHDDTSAFIRDTLLSPSVVQFIKDPSNNILLWAGTVQDAEAYQVSTALSCTKFPFSAVVVHTPSVSSTAMSIVQRLTGPTPPRDYLAKIQRTMDQHNAGLAQTRRVREEQNASRNLRQQQNEAYERSLAQDRERARQKREDEQRRKDEEDRSRREREAKENHERNLLQWRQWRAATIAAEPSANAKDAVRISLRMPDGSRVIRKFEAQADVEELYAFVECYDLLHNGIALAGESQPVNFEHEYKFRLVSPVPREVYELEAGGTILDRIGRSGNLIVEKTDLDDSGDEEEELSS